MSGLEQRLDRWKYPTVDELLDRRHRLGEVVEQLGWLVQAYLVGGEQIHVHIEFIADGQRRGVRVSFVAFRYSPRNPRSLVDWLPPSVYEVDGGDAVEHVQAPVLVRVAEELEGQQGMSEGVFGW